MKLPEIEDVRVVLFDLDGTIYIGSKVLQGANECIEFFRNRGISVFFTTNNSTKTRKQIYERLMGMGIDCRLDEVLTSGFLAAMYALRNGMSDVYVFGSHDLSQELKDAGVAVTHDERAARNLLIGYDPAMSYEELSVAVRIAMNADCVMACNKERVYPGEGDVLMPGCGAMTAPVEWCANRPCDVVIGKPSSLMVEMVCDELGVAPKNALVVGDTYESDVLMARRASCRAVLLTDKVRRDVPTVRGVSEIPLLFV